MKKSMNWNGGGENERESKIKQEHENTCVCGEKREREAKINSAVLNWQEAGMIKIGKTRRVAYRV